MFKRFNRIVLAGVLVLSVLLTVRGATASAPEKFVKGQYIVVFKDSVGESDQVTDEIVRGNGLGLLHKYGSALKGFAAKIPDAKLEKVKADPRVAFVSADGIAQADAMQTVLSGDSVPTGVRRIGAGTTTSVHKASTVNVAVIDTGITLTHPDLNAVSGKNCVSTGKTANDDNGHGTHVSGTIAAKNNGSGVVGVAPGTRLYAVKVLNSQGSGTFSQIICGIDWVTANAKTYNIKVASMSLGGSGSNDNNCGNTNGDAMHKAICNSVKAGITYVVAAGNSSARLESSVPAAYPEVLTVTAMTDSDGKPGGTGGAPSCRTGERDDYYASYSNYAATTAGQNHTVAAPGTCIKSDWLSGGYNTISGTSMATPHVSGVVALCFGNGGTNGPCAGLTPAQVIQKIRADAKSHATSSNGFSGDPFRPISGKYFGYLLWGGY